MFICLRKLFVKDTIKFTIMFTQNAIEYRDIRKAIETIIVEIRLKLSELK